MLNKLDLELEFVERTDYLDSKSGQFGFNGKPFMEGTQSSPAAKLARHMQQQQSSGNVVTTSPSADRSLIQNFASTQDLVDRSYGLEKSPSDCPTLGPDRAQSNEDEGRPLFSMASNPQNKDPTVDARTWDKNYTASSNSTIYT